MYMIVAHHGLVIMLVNGYGDSQCVQEYFSYTPVTTNGNIIIMYINISDKGNVYVHFLLVGQY